MIRVLLAILGTVTGIVLLLSFKTHPVAAGSAHGLPAAALGPSVTSPAPIPGGSPPSAAPPNPGSSPGSSANSSPGARASRTIAGAAVQTRYGVVQVQVVASGSQIQNVSFLQLTAVDPRSQEINDQAGPILLQETLSAQSGQIDTVSGATYTSQGYLESLQSALDQAGIK
jgi:uncharacterized protein with FMN-binding domain